MSAVRNFRKSQKWDIETLARKLNIRSINTAYQVEAGSRSITLDTAKELEKVSGISRVVWLYPNEYENPYNDK